MKSTLVSGKFVRAEDQTHPLQMKVKLILSPFTANANKMGIPISEADNFIRTAKNQPFKINFNGNSGGHDLAYPVGLVYNAELSELDSEPVITGDVIVWKDEFPSVAEYLEKAVAAGEAHTSWELYYGESDFADGVEWLRDIIFAGTCVVSDPAYRGKTPILAVAQMDEQIKQLQETIDALTADKEQLTNDLRLATDNLTQVTEQLAQANEQFAHLSIEVTTLKESLNKYQEADRTSKINQRKEQLSALGIEDVEQYLDLEDTAFQLVISAASKAANKAAASVENPVVPHITGNSNHITAKELAKAIRGK